ncbi:MAG: serine hydrolase [Pseudidiomarina sp.]|nr:serine hydrolase [Pseudidiomarina sp.]
MRALRLSLFGVVAALSVHAPLTASAAETETTIQAYAAGYKAAFTCSATFNGGKSMELINAHELTGIYPLVQDLVTQLPVFIDPELRMVQVAYDDLPPRTVVWRPQLGCVQLPVGATADVAAMMPRLADPQPKPGKDSGAPWVQLNPINSSTGNDLLDTAIRGAFSDHYGAGARTTAVLIATPEQIIAEHYLDGFTPETSQRTWSVAKSIGASVIGVAVQQGLVKVNEPAGLENWSYPADPRGQITLEHLLHMASGLDSNVAGNRTDRVYLGGGLVSDTATQTALEVPPGTRWKYANNDTLLALRTLRERFTDVNDYLAFPFKQLLNKIGMQHTFPETDWQGDFILSSQVWTTSRDLARLGILHLQNGRWNDEQILPENWLSYISTPAPAQPPAQSSAGSPIPGYGAQWWLFNERFPELPDDTIAARGNRGQYLFIIPSENLVIVRRGYDLAGEPPFREHEFARDVLRALKAVE